MATPQEKAAYAALAPEDKKRVGSMMRAGRNPSEALRSVVDQNDAYEREQPTAKENAGAFALGLADSVAPTPMGLASAGIANPMNLVTAGNLKLLRMATGAEEGQEAAQEIAPGAYGKGEGLGMALQAIPLPSAGVAVKRAPFPVAPSAGGAPILQRAAGFVDDVAGKALSAVDNANPLVRAGVGLATGGGSEAAIASVKGAQKLAQKVTGPKPLPMSSDPYADAVAAAMAQQTRKAPVAGPANTAVPTIDPPAPTLAVDGPVTQELNALKLRMAQTADDLPPTQINAPNGPIENPGMAILNRTLADQAARRGGPARLPQVGGPRAPVADPTMPSTSMERAPPVEVPDTAIIEAAPIPPAAQPPQPVPTTDVGLTLEPATASARRPAPPAPTQLDLPETAVMPGKQLGELRLESARGDAPVSPWSDAIDEAGVPVFDEFGNELPNPAIKMAWRKAAARHAAPIEGGPTSTAGMLDEDVNALLGRGGRTKGGLQGSSAYWAKRNRDLAQQSVDPDLSPDVRQSAKALRSSSRTAPENQPAATQPLDPTVPQTPEDVARWLRSQGLPAEAESAMLSQLEPVFGTDMVRAVRQALDGAPVTSVGRRKPNMRPDMAGGDSGFPVDYDMEMRLQRREPAARPSPPKRDNLTLWRASEDPIARKGAHFSEQERAAVTYSDNGEFGGPIVGEYPVSVDRSRVLDATDDDGWRVLADRYLESIAATDPARHARFVERASEAGVSPSDFVIADWRGQHKSHVFQVLEDVGGAEEALRGKYDWVRYPEQFPSGTTTWKHLGDEPIAPRLTYTPGKQIGPQPGSVGAGVLRRADTDAPVRPATADEAAISAQTEDGIFVIDDVEYYVADD